MRSAVRYFVLAIALAGFGACSSTSITTTPPPYIGEVGNYVYHETGEDLGRYLRFDQSCGPFVSAHRGGPLPGYPENSLEALRKSVRTGPVFLEVDIRATSDGVFVLMHDETLDRTTNGSGRLDETNFRAVRALHLRDPAGVVTPFQIPSLSETLAWARGRAILTLDVKQGVSPELLIKMIRQHDAEGSVIIIVYSIDDFFRYNKIAPDLIYSVSFSSARELETFLSDGETLDNIIVWTGVGTPDTDLVRTVHDENALAMAGTFGDLDNLARLDPESVYGELLDLGIDVVATDLVPLASTVVNRSRLSDSRSCAWYSQ